MDVRRPRPIALGGVVAHPPILIANDTFILDEMDVEALMEKPYASYKGPQERHPLRVAGLFAQFIQDKAAGITVGINVGAALPAGECYAKPGLSTVP
ncbi:hypothetical protein Ppa06_37550 [Planomonospora parontospora subsp. parontospora]|uniref:Uncharacterized protein n=2 Tax=Planomonospora parontospora TaxID=58119 RepID=A0AA37BIW2_9ACTN|nr:hypothetical protein GCM10010126_41350 [Planomonospora parontospora]GII09957.1 hypothetical protein Ppa06_37550 [Planomonospora parontospora subsp. parontospora]